MTAIIICIILGMFCLISFGALMFNDEHIDWGVTLFAGFLGFMLIAIPVSYLLLKVYR